MSAASNVVSFRGLSAWYSPVASDVAGYTGDLGPESAILGHEARARSARTGAKRGPDAPQVGPRARRLSGRP